MSDLYSHYIEYLTSFIGILTFPLGIHRNKFYWPIGIALLISRLYTFHYDGLYASFIMQLLSIFISLYGWYCWNFKKEQPLQQQHQELSRVTIKEAFYCLIIGSIWGAALFILGRQQEGAQPFLDGLKGSFQLIGLYLSTQKRVESYWVWSSYNLITLLLQIAVQRWLYMVQYGIYLLGSMYGGWKWHQEWKQSKLSSSAY